MTFQISIGFSSLENPNGKDEQSKTFALFVGDTVVVNEVSEKNARVRRQIHRAMLVERTLHVVHVIEERYQSHRNYSQR